MLRAAESGSLRGATAGASVAPAVGFGASADRRVEHALRLHRPDAVIA